METSISVSDMQPWGLELHTASKESQPSISLRQHYIKQDPCFREAVRNRTVLCL